MGRCSWQMRGEPQHAERRVLGGLQHQHVAGAQRGRDLERAEHDRRIPGNDGADHADRLAPGVAQHVLAERDRLALQLAGETAEIANDVGRALGLGAGLRAQGVAGLLGDDAGQLLHPRLDGVGDLLQHAAAFARDDLAPAGERLACGLHGAVDILGAPARDAGDDLPIAGRFNRDRLARRRVDPAAVDQHLHALAGSGGRRLAHCHCHCCILLDLSQGADRPHHAAPAVGRNRLVANSREAPRADVRLVGLPRATQRAPSQVL